MHRVSMRYRSFGRFWNSPGGYPVGRPAARGTRRTSAGHDEPIKAEEYSSIRARSVSVARPPPAGSSMVAPSQTIGDVLVRARGVTIRGCEVAGARECS